ncbi:MAG: efflux RND transporter periplasmic adaptor subunit, partial [Bacteroidia bacterium]
AEVQVKAANSFALPEDAIVRFENKQYAFVKKADRTFEMINVEVGVLENGFIQVIGGQSLADKTFVVKGAYTLLMSLKNKAEEE